MRLKGNKIAGIMPPLTMFQFQTGAIKRLPEDSDFHHDDVFQFQTGAIKSFIVMVYGKICQMFQFQTGAIKSFILT